MKLIYVCSPFSGDKEANIENAKRYCSHVIDCGEAPIASHLHYPLFLDDDNADDRELGLKFAKLILSKCDEIWVYGERLSGGMQEEIAFASKNGIPIRCFGNVKM